MISVGFSLTHVRAFPVFDSNSILQAVEAVTASQQPCHQSCQQRAFDLILMDGVMPVMDGCEATQRIRQLGFDGMIMALTGPTSPLHMQFWFMSFSFSTQRQNS